jgi:threonine aldolase
MVYAPVPDDPSLPPIRINLFSDTQTRPSPGMREAIAAAEVGDEQIGDDPTVNALCERVADLLGKEAAVFMPSGTICNIAATLTHCRPGDEVLAHETAHIVSLEGGTHAALGGVQIRALHGANGQFTPDRLRQALRPADRHQARQALVCVEQTTNLGGGTIWQQSALDAVADIAKVNGPATHIVYFDVSGAGITNKQFAAALRRRGVLISIMGGRLRGCTHLDITNAMIADTLDIIGDIVRTGDRRGGRTTSFLGCCVVLALIVVACWTNG